MNRIRLSLMAQKTSTVLFIKESHEIEDCSPFAIGLTPTVRAAIATLDLNRERVITIRTADKEVGRYPPDGDLI